MNRLGRTQFLITARVLVHTLLLTAFCLQVSYLQAQSQEEPQQASWITQPEISGNEFGVYHFRKEFGLEAVPERFTIHVSADNRYRLYVNGVSIVAGPQRSDVMHWRFEEVDIAPWLRAGNNVIAAVVWNWGEHKPVAQHSFKTAFLVRGATAAEAIVNTGSRPWKVLANRAYSAIPVSREQVGGYYASPPGEQVDAGFYPWGWKSAAYDDTAWQDAVETGPALDRGSFPFNAGGWQLVARSIPFMDEHPVRFASVRRTEGITTDGGSPGFQAVLDNAGTLVVPANTRGTLLLDQAHLTNAYLELETSKGAGSRITVTYAEALKDEQGIKGHRDEIEGKSISGLVDVFQPDGGDHRRFQTLWFRTYRYVELNIETGSDPLEIHDVRGLYTAYPMTLEAGFESDLPWLEEMWAINWRVLRLCAWETYFDTPYYEQLQYIGDTRLQALLSLYLSGDDRLMRQAITHFEYSRIPEGITASRYPSDLGQYIPTFSLFWVAMVHDYWMLRDDRPYVRGLLPGVRGVLGWFEDKVDETGLVGPLPWWPFADWTDDWSSGMAPGGKDGHSVLITLQYVYALQRAVELESSFGRQAEANRLLALAGDLLDAVKSKAYDSERGLFRDSLEQSTFSQHTNALAILTGAVPEDERPALMERVLDDSSLTQPGYYFKFYIFEALREAGLGNRYLEKLAPWQDMLALGLTTTPEQPAPSRTDSHAWAAHPNYGLLATVLGIRPGEPGFKSVVITPHLGPLQEAEGRMPHPLGLIEVKLRRIGEGGIEARITLPDGLEGVFDWRGEKVTLRPGPQVFELHKEWRSTEPESSETASPAQPNIIFILTDDQRFDALGFAGNDIIHTPAMDRLAEEGSYFGNALVTSPICAASRASIFTGLYERTHRYTFQAGPVSEEYMEQSYPALLRGAGYYTGFFGKFGVRYERAADLFDEYENLYIGEDPDHRGYFNQELDGEPVHLTRYAGQKALDFIEAAPRDKPFALSLSFNAPHAHDGAELQYFWQEEMEPLYQDVEIPAPLLGGDEHFERLPAAVREGFNRERWYWRYDTPEKYQHSVKGYYRMISGIDLEIAKIREKLVETGLDENTVIILMGDNGYFLGERQLAGKWLMYDNSIRVPLVIYDPRAYDPQTGAPRAGAHVDVDDMALNIDVTATIVDLAGIPVPAGYQGKSLLSVVQGRADSLARDAVLIEHLWEFDEIPPSEGVRTDEWKYLRYVHDKALEELYDLRRDPHESRNLAGDPDHQETLADLRAQLEEMIGRYGGGSF